MAQPATVPPERVIATITADWNEDGGFDRAVLVQSEDGADLIVYMSDGDSMKPVAFAPDLVWSGNMWGTQPSLELSPAGGLKVLSGNDAIGRSRWQQTLTLAWRNEAWVVAGVTTMSRDTLDPDAGGTCDINFLTGKGTAYGKAVKKPVGAIPVADWTVEKVPAGCL
ncbi:hypothetical protein ABI_34170 [Asticcacaulis biprosthecium C19]|uniref:Uncharacterized protein n=1 Tax=Asticcacaulis biprosthecium C19 TaxID=715226 RepID=F4QQA9_9CAUL|nr:hypothetical protein ABI_34170 [Asticcacaulis biprosthecium C19]